MNDMPISLTASLNSNDLDEPIELISGEMQLQIEGEESIDLQDSRLYFRWVPSTAIEFEANYIGFKTLYDKDPVLIIPEESLQVEVIIASQSGDFQNTQIRGIVKKGVLISYGKDSDKLRFHLANMPSFIGNSVATEKGGFSRSRLEMKSSELHLIADEIPNMNELRTRSNQAGGNFISHICELTPITGTYSDETIDDLVSAMSFLFSFIRGAPCGPILPQGYLGDDLHWSDIRHWHVGQSGSIHNWAPRNSIIELDAFFTGFMNLWNDDEWNSPLRRAMHWYTEVNKKELPADSIIVLSQVALEMLSWVYLVERKNIFNYNTFKKKHAHEKLRDLLDQLSIDSMIPGHLKELTKLIDSKWSMDGPESLTRIRNAIVHATKTKRDTLGSLTGLQIWEAGQLSIQYLELILLALFKYYGKYSLRGWRDWTGDSEVDVPWI